MKLIFGLKISYYLLSVTDRIPLGAAFYGCPRNHATLFSPIH